MTHRHGKIEGNDRKILEKSMEQHLSRCVREWNGLLLIVGGMFGENDDPGFRDFARCSCRVYCGNDQSWVLENKDVST
ncbi:hypothetical protein GTNG_1258 [Geobacillus thermodenitrificans NG80-2]|uniref:Uncharacterized protein n=1 Tax=Geobacillus thermodenitrificans (strain NG80-2) TaxID=420246 RepID=A4IMS4_GEOTN|nr:hypothetical protein GTNG_1258 [Geobacillus thermodenitrificans NG80-2]